MKPWFGVQRLEIVEGDGGAEGRDGENHVKESNQEGVDSARRLGRHRQISRGPVEAFVGVTGTKLFEGLFSTSGWVAWRMGVGGISGNGGEP